MTINEAIAKVLTTQYKKDAKEAHEMVESAGYKIWKRDGDWWVKNEKTNRWVYMPYDWHYKYKGSWTLHTNNTKADYGCRQLRYPETKPIPIDFERLLATPYNKEWYMVRKVAEDYEYWKGAKSEKYYTFTEAKRTLANDKRYLADAKAKLESDIKKLMREVEYYTEKKARDSERLNNLRKELGLKPKCGE